MRHQYFCTFVKELVSDIKSFRKIHGWRKKKSITTTWKLTVTLTPIWHKHDISSQLTVDELKSPSKVKETLGFRRFAGYFSKFRECSVWVFRVCSRVLVWREQSLSLVSFFFENDKCLKSNARERRDGVWEKERERCEFSKSATQPCGQASGLMYCFINVCVCVCVCVCVK